MVSRTSKMHLFPLSSLLRRLYFTYFIGVTEHNCLQNLSKQDLTARSPNADFITHYCAMAHCNMRDDHYQKFSEFTYHTRHEDGVPKCAPA